jgi:hypothetical protein
MKENYKQHLIESIESIYKAIDPNASSSVIYARMYGALSAIVTTEQLELLLKCAIDAALANSAKAVVESNTNK